MFFLHSANLLFTECFFCRVFLAQHSAKNLFAECPRKYTRQTEKHSETLRIPVVALSMAGDTKTDRNSATNRKLKAFVFRNITVPKTKFIVKFCILYSCYDFDCYCCLNRYDCYKTRDDCMANCPACNPKCPP